MRSTSRAPSSQSSASGSVRRISAREALAYQQAQAVAVAAQRQQAIAMASMGLPPSSYSHNGLLHHNGPQSGPSSHMSNGGTHSPTDGPSNGTASINTNGGFITIRQLDPESATIQIPLPQTLRDLRRIATKTFRLTTPHIVLHGPQGEIVDLNFPLLMDGDHIDIQVRKPRIVTAGFMDPTAEAALALTRLASAE